MIDVVHAAVHPVVVFVSALTPIAREVGVTLPPTGGWAERIAAVDGIDIEALAADAALLRSLTGRVDEAVAGVGSAADGLPAAWSGVAADSAHATVMDLHRAVDETAARLRAAAGACDAAVRGVVAIRAALHATLDAVPTAVVAGRAIADLTHLDVDVNRAVIAAMVHAAVGTVEAALTVAETAVTEVLTVLADGTMRLAEPPSSADGVATRRVDVATGSTVVGAPAVVGALAGAGVAAAAAVGMAAVGAAGVVAQVVDAVLDEPDAGTPRPDAANAVPPRPDQPAPQSDPSTAQPASTAPPSEPHVVPRPTQDFRPTQDLRPTQDDPPPAPVRPQLNLRVDDTPPPAPPNRGGDAHGEVEQSPPDDAPVAAAPVRSADPPPSPEHATPRPAATTESGPRSTPDPDDGGGLALAGDR